MTRVAVPLLLAFVALLVFIYVITDRRRTRAKELAVAHADQITALNVLVHDIQKLAREASDVDPSAALIDHMIQDYKTKELR